MEMMRGSVVSQVSYPVPKILMGALYRGSEFSSVGMTRPEYFTAKMHFFMHNDEFHYQVLLSMPTSYSVSEAVLHSIEHFNYKLSDFRLRMQTDMYAMVKAGSNGKPDS